MITRLAPVSYADGIAAPAHPSFPNPRTVSNALFNQSVSLPDANRLSEYVWVWGQFLDHDIDHTLLQSVPSELT